MGDLIPVGGSDGGGLEHCVRCGALAAGPCARCGAPVCGGCCVLTEGGAGVWAICTSCARGKTPSLRGPWATVLAWILIPIVLLFVLVALLAVFGR